VDRDTQQLLCDISDDLCRAMIAAETDRIENVAGILAGINDRIVEALIPYGHADDERATAAPAEERDARIAALEDGLLRFVGLGTLTISEYRERFVMKSASFSVAWDAAYAVGEALLAATAPHEEE
jgi:hypothetical protein